MELTYRFLDAGSDTEIVQWLDLYRVCYHHSVSREYWDWIHMTNPFYRKTKPLVFIAVSGNRIVGSISIIPSPLRIMTGQNIIPLNSCLVCKAMVHPEYQGRGIFSTLLENAIRVAKEEEYDLLITFSNNRYSFQGFVRSGFFHITDITQTRCYLSSQGPLKNQLAGLPHFLRNGIGYPISWMYRQLLPGTRHTFHTDFHDATEDRQEIDTISVSTPARPGIYGIRTPLFVSWRFSYPGFHFKCLSIREGHQMLAYLIIEYRHGGKDAMIIDLFVRNNDYALIMALVSELLVILHKEGFDTVQTYFPKTDWGVQNVFSLRHGFIDQSRGSVEKTTPRFLCYNLKDNQYTQEFSRSAQWAIQSADTCMFWGA